MFFRICSTFDDDGESRENAKNRFLKIQINVPGKIRIGIRSEFSPGSLSEVFEKWFFAFSRLSLSSFSARPPPAAHPPEEQKIYPTNKSLIDLLLVSAVDAIRASGRRPSVRRPCVVTVRASVRHNFLIDPSCQDGARPVRTGAPLDLCPPSGISDIQGRASPSGC